MFSTIRDRWPPDLLSVSALSAGTSEIELPSGEERWLDLLKTARRERVANIVYHRLNGRQDAREIPAPVMGEFEAVYLSILRKNIITHKNLTALLAAFESTAIPCMPLKGALLSRHLYADIGMRDMGDVDILVKRENVGAADSLLEREGFAVIEGGEGGGDYRNSRLYARRDGQPMLLIHLHWHLVNASIPLVYRSAIDMNEIWDDARPIVYGSARAMAPSPSHLVCHLAEHAMKHSFSTLILVADAARVFEAFRGGEATDYTDLWGPLDERRLAETAVRWRIRRPLHTLLNLMRHAMGVEGLEGLIDRVRPRDPNLWDRLFQKSLAANKRRDGLSVAGYLSMAGGVAGQCRLARGMLFPPSSAMRSFGKEPTLQSYARRLRNGFRMLARTL